MPPLVAYVESGSVGGHLVLVMRQLLDWVLDLQLSQVLAHRSVDLRSFGQLLSRNTTLLGSVCLNEGPIDRNWSPRTSPTERHWATTSSNNCSNTFRFLESPVAILREASTWNDSERS